MGCDTCHGRLRTRAEMMRHVCYMHQTQPPLLTRMVQYRVSLMKPEMDVYFWAVDRNQAHDRAIRELCDGGKKAGDPRIIAMVQV